MFGDILKNLMLSTGLTQQKLADKIGYAQRTVSSWINNQSEPTERAIAKCATFFDVSADYLLGLEDDFGTRTAAPSSAVAGENLSAEERQIIEEYRKLPESSKDLFRRMAGIKTTMKK